MPQLMEPPQSLARPGTGGSVRTRRVLMICAAFPPTGGPGVQRSAKFARYLGQFGWQPTVWAAAGLRGLPLDDTLLGDLPESLKVHRTDAPLHRPVTTEPTWLTWRLQRWGQAFRVRIPPDDMLPWAIKSLGPLRNLVADAKFDAIYTTFSPASNHLLGWWLKRATGLPWVADFRDLWTDDCTYRQPWWRRAIDRRLESRFLHAADAIIGVTDSQRDLLLARSPGSRTRFVTISNGVDLADLAGIDAAMARRDLHGPPDRFVVVFCGWFHSDRVQPGLIEGLARFGKNMRAGGAGSELRIVGTISQHMRQRLADSGLDVVVTGYVPHGDAIRHMHSADVLLLPAPSGPRAETLMPAKVFEYLATGRPILLVGSLDGEVQRLVRRKQAGWIVEQSAEAVAHAATDIHALWQSGTLPAGAGVDGVAEFDRKRLTHKLAALLDEIVPA